MRYHLKRKRKRAITLVEPLSDEKTTKWWNTSVRRGVAIVIGRIADEVFDGTVGSISFSWDGGDQISFSAEKGGEKAEGRVQLDARACDTGIYERSDHESR